jgi:hypothetical protein
LNVIGFTMAIFVVQIGIIFSSLVVDPLPDKSVTFVSSGAKPSTEA